MSFVEVMKQSQLMFSRKWTHIVLHHSYTEDGKTVDWTAIKRYHIEEKGWDDIGYHFGIERVDDKYQLMIGRPLSKVGAHTQGQMNYKAIGICIIGKYDFKLPNKEAIRLLRKLVWTLKAHFKIVDENIHCHSEHSGKTCPGLSIKPDIWRLILL